MSQNFCQLKKALLPGTLIQRALQTARSQTALTGRTFSAMFIAWQARDSTGLKVFGEGEWLEQKHKTKRKRRSWRKLHPGLNLVSSQIVCSDLITDDIGNLPALPDLLDQIGGPVKLFLADGAYDGEPPFETLSKRFGPLIEVAIPPPKNAILRSDAARRPTFRECHIAEIKAHGRMAWQKASGYNQRSRSETLMGRWKTVIGPRLESREFENQMTEGRIGVRILNRMTGLGRPNFKRIA